MYARTNVQTDNILGICPKLIYLPILLVLLLLSSESLRVTNAKGTLSSTRGLISASSIIGNPVKSIFVSTRDVDFGIIIDQGMCVRVHTFLYVQSHFHS